MTEENILYYVTAPKSSSASSSAQDGEEETEAKAAYRRVLSVAEKKEIIENYHQKQGHYRQNKIQQKIAKRFYWVGMTKDITVFLVFSLLMISRFIVLLIAVRHRNSFLNHKYFRGGSKFFNGGVDFLKNLLPGGVDFLKKLLPGGVNYGGSKFHATPVLWSLR